MRKWLVASLVAASLWCAVGQNAESQVAAEIQRLRRSLKDHPLRDPDVKGIGWNAEEAMKASSEALKTGQLYLSLERLARAIDLLGGARTAADKAEVEKGGMAAFETKWANANRELTAAEQQTRSKDWNTSPAGVRALAESARGKVMPLLDGARGFAVATKPVDGLFYLGQAKGESDFAAFCASLKVAREGSPSPQRSLAPELQALQEKVNAAFVPPRSIDMHPRFIALNAAIKAARELDAERFYSGAMYQYLEAVRHYGMLDATAPDAAGQSAIKAQIAATTKKLESSAQDDSIALIFLQRAASQIAHADASAPEADELRSASVIVEHVIPVYYSALKPASVRPKSTEKTVDVTLVRWPYT